MCKEYDQLKTQFDLESTTMQKAMERATEVQFPGFKYRPQNAIISGSVT